MEIKYTVIFLLILGLCMATEPNRWFPSNFSISDLRLNISYPIVNYEAKCQIDTYPINYSNVVSVSFEVLGCGANISTSNVSSIGTLNQDDKIMWQSEKFNITSLGTLSCTVQVQDSYGHVETQTKQFICGNELGTCGTGPDCTIDTAVELLPGNIYHYRNINVTSSGQLFNNLGYAENLTYGDIYTIYADGNFTQSGHIDLNGDGCQQIAFNHEEAGMQAGYLNINVAGDYNQTGHIEGAGVTGCLYQHCGYIGGHGLGINVTADHWNQIGYVSSIAGNGATPDAGPCPGVPGGYVPYLSFNGRQWDSLGDITLDSGAGTNAFTSGGGGQGGDIYGIIIHGILNKIAGIVYILPGSGGSGAGSYGGRGGNSVLFAYVEGAIYFVQNALVSWTSSNGGAGRSSTFGGDAGDGVFIYGNVTYFVWNATSISITLGTGGQGFTGAVGGNGGDWLNTGNTTYEGISCHDTCSIISQINLLGGAAGAGTPAGSAGQDASWEVQYYSVSSANNFTKLGPARTTYNRSSDSSFYVPLTLSVLPFYLSSTDFLALEYLMLNWTSSGSFYDIKISDGNDTYPLMDTGLPPTPFRTFTTNHTSIDTNRFHAGNWTFYVRQLSAYSRFSDWNSSQVIISLANSSIVGSTGNLTSGQYRTVQCNFTGYDMSYNGVNWAENLSYINECYQESANITNQTGVDGNCGLLYTGNYNFSNNFNDGNWTSYATIHTIYLFNYTKPPNANSNSTILLGEDAFVLPSSHTYINYSVTIPSSCFSYSPTDLYFQLNTTPPISGSQLNLSCYNGSDWIQMISNYTGIGTSLYAVEEAMNWEINSTLTPSIPHATIYVYAEDNGSNKTFTTTFNPTTMTYDASIGNNFTAGDHNVYCNGNKANYLSSTSSAGSFTAYNFTVILPSGVTSVQIICPFPTFSGARPVGQTSFVPIFRILNGVSNPINVSLGLVNIPTNVTVYFNNNYSRVGQTQFTSTNKTVCINVPPLNSTSCNVWLFGDCNNAPPGLYQMNYTWGQEG